MIRTRCALAVLLALIACRIDASGIVQSDGATVTFEIVRQLGDKTPVLAEAVAADEGGIHRLLVDADSQRYFGYTVHVVPSGLAYELTLGPLDPKQVAALSVPGWRRLGEPHAIEYPPAQMVRAGEPLLFELLVNPATGEKILDLIRVQPSASKPVSPASGESRIGEVQVVDALVTVNGHPVPMRGSAGPAGYVYFFICGRGRFVVSAQRIPGRDSTALSPSDSRIVTFTAGDDRYEWTSAEPFAARSASALWLWHDRDYQCPAGRPHGLGAGRDVSQLAPHARARASR